ncbi:glycoside hydrolase family 9 protein [Leptolyngbya cf. ectocarpi LEGE 11479]|uniref:Endoglucanase n=1 Tax=Leptolyngbya cf. ectocarpi LEGE 11479 TaxID=1828722 RepID=A0A928WXH4_LEPEC|nr:glycoside hydrolase family 9 protein [Leptolyngbya ectocarpi]MBE9065229.1 glycoside hydrolase family 9 protein [Leptolyngbya cf. ectocarpi LEGE 11479]
MRTTFEASQDWGSGLVGFFSIENNGTTQLEQWVITIETTFEIETLWGGEILERVGNRYTVGATSWNSHLDPGESTKFGFVGQDATAYPHQVTVIPQTPVEETVLDSTSPDQSIEPAQAAIESVDFTVDNQWGHGFVANLSFTYTGSQPTNSWELQFEAPFHILNLWHGELVEQEGDLYTIRNAHWNNILLPGDTITLGFQAAGAVDIPTDYYFNGDPVGDALGKPVVAVPEKPAVPDVSESDPQPVDTPEPKEPLEKPVDDAPIEDSPIEDSPMENPPIEQPVAEEPAPIDDAPIEDSPVAESPVKPPVVEAPPAAPPIKDTPEELPSDVDAPTASEKALSQYGEALQKSFLFYEAQRSGKLPDDNRIAWRGDSALNDGADVGIDLTGGYYDAGDHVKFGFPMAASTTMLTWGVLEYYDAYAQSGQLDEALDAIKWATDYFLKAHISDGQTTQAFYGQVGDPKLDHAYWGSPENQTIERPAYKIDPANPGSDLAAETAAALAAASIAFRATDPVYADRLLVNAKQLYAFADAYRGRYSESISQAKEYYNSWSGYTDELAWGAAWLYKATGESHYLDKAQKSYQNLGVDWTQNWDDKSYGTGVLLAQITDKPLYRTEVENWLNNWVSGDIAKTDGGLAWVDEWGSLRYSANTAFIAGVYSDTVNPAGGQYDAFSRNQIDYILGDNPAQQSYVAGIGASFPKNVHHRAASGTTKITDPAPNEYVLHGALVGGPRLPHDFSYTDERTDFLGNEVALDFNAGFTGAVARLYGQDGGGLLSDEALIALSQPGLSDVA